jgi:hypothetical protein
VENVPYSMTIRKTPTGRPPRLTGVAAALLSMRGVAAFWIAYGLIHAALRLDISRTLSIDDARATELVQHLSLGYQAGQPPLHEWLLWCAQQVFGTGIASDLFVRYSLIAVLGLACFGAVRAALDDVRWAAAASLSLAASYPVGWAFHEQGTPMILLSIACFATMHAAIRWLEKPSMGAAIRLGGAIGLGLLSKFTYPFFLGGLAIACLGTAETRRRLADPRLLVSAAIAFAMISPYLLWLANVQNDVAAVADRVIVLRDKSYLRRVLAGLARLVKSIPLFLLPWLAFVAVLAPSAFRSAAPGVAPAPAIERLALRTMIAAAALAVLGIVAAGAANATERYMHPVLIVAPVYVFARIRRFGLREASPRLFAALAVVAAAAVFCIRIAAMTDSGFGKRVDRFSRIPYETLAGVLEARGAGEGTIVTFDVRDAGNLRAFLPQLRVIAADSSRILRPPRRASDDLSCLLVYAKGRPKEPEKLTLFGALEPERIDVSAPPSRFGASRQGTWWVAKLDPGSAACR